MDADAARQRSLRLELQGELGHLGQPARHPPRRQLRERLRHPHGRRGQHLRALEHRARRRRAPQRPTSSTPPTRPPGARSPAASPTASATTIRSRRARSSPRCPRPSRGSRKASSPTSTTTSRTHRLSLPRSGDREPPDLGRRLLPGDRQTAPCSSGGWRARTRPPRRTAARRSTARPRPAASSSPRTRRAASCTGTTSRTISTTPRSHWESILDGESLRGSIKLGAARTESERDFLGRRIRYQHRDTRGIDLTQSPEELFSEQYIRPNGFEVEEITRATDAYIGNHDVNAGFAQADLGWGKWRLIAGARYEDSDLEVTTLDRTNPDLPTVETVLDDRATFCPR